MGTMASQITSLTIVYSTVHSVAKKTSKLHVIDLCAGNSPVTAEFPAQMASDVENVSIWWRYHENIDTISIEPVLKLCQFVMCPEISWYQSHQLTMSLSLHLISHIFDLLGRFEVQWVRLQLISVVWDAAPVNISWDL